MARTIYTAEIEDPITGELTILEADSPDELDALIEDHTSDPNTQS